MSVTLEYLCKNTTPVIGFDNYRISSDGRIFSLVSKPKELKTEVTRSGHIAVELRNEKGRHHCFIHTLVLTSFVGPRPNSEYVCRHLNDIPSDNRLENLCWGTHQENIEDMIRNKIRKNKEKMSRKYFIISKMKKDGYSIKDISLISRMPIRDINSIS